jgi:hypothetical protein
MDVTKESHMRNAPAFASEKIVCFFGALTQAFSAEQIRGVGQRQCRESP